MCSAMLAVVVSGVGWVSRWMLMWLQVSCGVGVSRRTFSEVPYRLGGLGSVNAAI
jgi:hypothetical protein